MKKKILFILLLMFIYMFRLGCGYGIIKNNIIASNDAATMKATITHEKQEENSGCICIKGRSLEDNLNLFMKIEVFIISIASTLIFFNKLYIYYKEFEYNSKEKIRVITSMRLEGGRYKKVFLFS